MIQQFSFSGSCKIILGFRRELHSQQHMNIQIYPLLQLAVEEAMFYASIHCLQGK